MTFIKQSKDVLGGTFLDQPVTCTTITVNAGPKKSTLECKFHCILHFQRQLGEIISNTFRIQMTTGNIEIEE